MGIRKIVGIILVIICLYFGIYYVVTGFNAIRYLLTPPSERPATAEIFVNSSGVFLKLPLSFDNEKMWVDAIIVTGDTWILDNPAIEQVGAPPMPKHTFGPELRSEEIYKLIHMYSNKNNIIWIKKELGSGTYIFNITDIVNLQKGALYPIWHGKVVVGDKEYPLNSLGHVDFIEPRILDNSSIMTISIGVYRHIDHPIAVGGEDIKKPLLRKAWEMFRKGDIQNLVEYVENKILPIIIDAIDNGSIRLAWYIYPTTNYIPLETVKEWIKTGKLAVGVKLYMKEIIANATLTNPDTGFKCYIATIRALSIEMWSYMKEPKVEYTVKNVLYTTEYIPGYHSYAVIVVYRKTPYSYYKALGYIAKVNLLPINP